MYTQEISSSENKIILNKSDVVEEMIRSLNTYGVEHLVLGTDLEGITHISARVNWPFIESKLPYMRVNRPLDESNVIKIVEDDLNGRYRYQADAMRFDSTGRPFDFHHRSQALRILDQIEPGHTFNTIISIGFDENTYMSTDGNRSRSTKDDLFIKGDSDGNVLANAISLIIAFATEGDFSRSGKIHATRTASSLLSSADIGLQDYVEKYSDLAGRYFLPKAYLSAVHCVLAQVDTIEADKFMSQVVDRLNVTEGSASYHFIKWVSKKEQGRKKTPTVVAMTLMNSFLKHLSKDKNPKCRKTTIMPDFGRPVDVWRSQVISVIGDRFYTPHN